MVNSQVRSGVIEYSGRAFQQDAQEAMRGDIARGIIELITNCDDAYVNAEGKVNGKIITSRFCSKTGMYQTGIEFVGNREKQVKAIVAFVKIYQRKKHIAENILSSGNSTS